VSSPAGGGDVAADAGAGALPPDASAPGIRPGRIGLVLHPRRDVAGALRRVSDWAHATGITLAAVDDPRLPAGVQRVGETDLGAGSDLVLALGGDGTMLAAMRMAAPHGVPVLGANLGRLGYLTEVDGEHLPDALRALAEGRFAVEERLALRAVWRRDGALSEGISYNDVVLSRVAGHGQAALALRVDGQLLVRYASDGLVVATPAGSTAYNFAAGGPIISPQTRAMVVTPDAAHGLFNRSVVLGDGERLGVELLASSAPVAVEVDGRLVAEVHVGWDLEISPSPQPALVVRLGAGGFAERARRKLGISDPAAIADFEPATHER
jgi:NAD+ kinase